MNQPNLDQHKRTFHEAEIILRLAPTLHNQPNIQQNTQTNFNLNNLINPNNHKKKQSKNKFNTIKGISQNILYERQFKSILAELNLKVDFENHLDCQQLKQILFQMLKYPSSHLADLHSQANRLGNFDLPEQKQKSSQIFDQQTSNEKQYCPCCGFIKQEDQLKICSQKLQDIQNIGISTYLYFRSVLNVIILLLIMFFVYGIFALVTNIIASKDYHSIANQNYLILSMGSKQLNPTDKNEKLVFIQAWIGFIMVIIWGFVFYYLQKTQRQKEEQISRQSITAADFSILIENLPVQMNQIQLQKQFDSYSKEIQVNSLKITVYNEGKPFYLDESQIYNKRVKQILDQEVKLRQQIVDLVLQRQENQNFKTPKQIRQKIYFDYRCNQQNKKNEYQRTIKQVQKNLQQANIQKTTTAFVTFQTNKEKQLLTKGSKDKIFNKFKQFIPCSQNEKKFTIKLKKTNPYDNNEYEVQRSVSIQKAPQPQDVQWTNIGVSDCEIIYKKSQTYTITVLILGASFIIVYGLSLVQNKNSSSRYLSFFISFIISLINIIISQVIRKLCFYQRNLTKTRYQSSLALKSIIAQLINSILIPIMTNRFIKNNIYDPKGLVDDIFLLGITNAFLSPILKIFDTYYYYVRFMAWYTNRPSYKLQLQQTNLNQYASLMEFQAGYEYIYVINLFIFTCFFVSLQPIICVFSIMGLFLMYWAQKYSLFSRCRRPVPGTNILHAFLTQLIYFGGITYSLGSLMWSNFLPEGIPKNALIPNLLALGAGVIIMLMPYGLISQINKQQSNQQILYYKQCKKYLPSEYDRLNPATSKQAIKNFRTYMIKQKQKLKSASKQVQDKVLKLFKKQGRHNHQQGYNQGISNFVLNTLPIQNNSMNPQFAANFLFSGGQAQSSNNPLLNQIINFGNQTNPLNVNPLASNSQNNQITKALFGNLNSNKNQNNYGTRMLKEQAGNNFVHMFERSTMRNENQFNE